MALDLTTLYVIAALGMLVAGFVHLVTVATGRFGSWAALWGAGHLVVGFGTMMAVLNDSIGVAWAPNAGNPAAAIGYALIAGAVLRFARPEARLAPLLGIAAVLAAPLIVSDDPAYFHFRVAYLSTVRAGFDIVVVIAAVRLARRESLQTGWIVAALFAVTVPMFLGRAWLACGDHIGTRLTGVHDDLAAWLAAGQIAFIIFRAFALLILQAERGQNALRDQLERDWLTGALNRAGLDRIAGTLTGRHAPHRIAVMMLDVDRFKTLNDAQGHAAGDAALRTLADIAHETLGKHGHLVRCGGDEFLGLLPDVPADEAGAIANRIASQFARTMTQYCPSDFAPSVSIGLIEDHARQPLADLIARADQAMYRAKGDRRRSSEAYSRAA
ncbi:GGDEF domain-containing protein [Sphingomonas albertensis]|uniref:diguanylate cyclase n=1 Tax=Sphingomonas albertensis TaxID=2762591 RepID=A0ABR7ARL9_9SPHN|nr:GGDEF domain-containing protein [Sphingomonas albertensis]MBC3943119.1 GGDEF domain-containing protein [Sphingomonas albertensis]